VIKQSARYKWVLVAVLCVISALNYGDRSALAAVFPLLRQDLGLSDLQLGLVGSAFLWTYGLGCPVAGFLADRFSRRRLIVLSLTLWSLATLLVAFVHGFRELMLARLVLGAAECLYIPATLALIADHHGPSTRGVAISSNLAGMSIGLIAGGTLAGYIAQTWGWRDAFSLLGWFGLGLAVVAWFLVHDAPAVVPVAARPEEKVSLRSNLRLLLHTRSYYMIVLQGMLSSAGAWMFWNWLPLYYQETYHMSLTGAGFSGTFMLQATAMLGILLGGYASDRFGRNHPPRRALVMAASYFCAAPLLLVFLFKPSYVLVSAGIALFSLLRAFGQANENLMICDLLPPRARSTSLGIFLLGNNAAGSLAILLAGWLRGELGLSFAFACVSGLVAISAVAALVAYYLMPRDLANVAAREAAAR
jgi:predicted MFS family arabinose efflux permease